jgi:hypothetical protein
MQKWVFDPVWSRLTFTDDTGFYTNDTPCIGEWRWGFHRDGSRFVAGLHTRDNHDVDHMEIQTDASFGARYFEDWDLGVHTWMGGDIDRDGLPDRWERAHSSGYTNLQPHADNDHDGIDNLSEFRAGTNPVDRHSLLRFVDATWTGMGLRLSWQSVSGHSYALSRSPDVFDPQSYVDICNRILGDPDLTVITDAQMTWPGPWFYRVRDEGLPPPLPVATTGLLAYYDFQGNALDRSGNARHATLLGGAHCVSGSMGACLFLDGQDDCVQTPLNINPALLPELTMSAWVQPMAYNGRRQILSHDDGDFDRSLLIQDGYWTVFTGGQRWTLDRKVVIDKWQHLVLVMDASHTYLYVDGNWESGPDPGNGASGNLLRLGDNPGPYEEHFFGYMDEVRIYNRALSAAEVWELYANPQLDLPGE